MSDKMQLNFRISDKLLEQVKNHVDGIEFRSVGHILNIALAEWLAKMALDCPGKCTDCRDSRRPRK